MTIFFVFNLRIYNSIKHRHNYKRVLTCSYPQRKIVDPCHWHPPFRISGPNKFYSFVLR